MKKIFQNLFVFFTVMFFTTAVVIAQTSSGSVAKLVSVTTDDLVQAGFASPKVQPPTGDGNYPASASYFWVGADAKPSPVNNLITVSSITLTPDVHTLFGYGTTQKTFEVNGGIGKEATLVGTRTAINFIKNQTYVVVIGPTTAETEALAAIVASKIK